jgi:quinol-cytochrome oxidoreductase complex cytochrome b subunit
LLNLSPTNITTNIGNTLNSVVDWVRSRLNNIDIFDEHYQNEAKTNPFYALGSIFHLVWFIVMLTGCLLIMWYIPTKAAAFDSILKIQEHIPFGGLIRGMHKYGADAMIIAATMRLYRMFLLADYKPGKEFNIAICFISLLLSMYSGLTGYLLIWNQRAFWATKVFATFPTYMDQFPVMGDFYLPLMKSVHMGWNTAEILLGGGAAITQETITRFFSIHLAFSLIPLIFVELYFYHNSYKRNYLSWLKRSIIILMLVAVSIAIPAAQGHRSNPDVTPLPILSDWYFLGLYQMYKYLEPVVATEITMLIPLTVILLPFIDSWITGPEKDISKRPLVFMTTIMGCLCWVIFSYLIIVNIANIHNDPPYWRLFLYGLVDFGIFWQLYLMWQTTEIPQRLKNAKGALIMAAIGMIQAAVSIVYYFMAKTEMFLSPLIQGWAYALCKPFAGDDAGKAESLVKELAKTNPEYWNFHTLVQPSYVKAIGTPLGYESLKKLAQVCDNSHTPIDIIFKLIPTFEPAPHAAYTGMLDYMINNRWCNDYLTFVDRVTKGVIPPYPLNVPELDLLWMWLSLAVIVASLIVWWKSKESKVKPVAEAKTPAPTVISST